MDLKEPKKQTPPSLLPITTTTKDDSTRKIQPNIGCNNISSNNIRCGGGVVAGGGGDRLKRDEWSEGAVSSLLEAYEAKWIQRNRAKLKGHDWEDVAKYVSCHANSTKTQTQCKNKIESMKKRYRSESASSDPSSWPLFPRLDLLLRRNAPPLRPSPPPLPHVLPPPPLILIEPLSQSPPAQPLRPPPPPLLPATVPITVASPSTLAPVAPRLLHLGVAQNSFESNGVDRITKQDGMDTKMSDKADTETDSTSSTPALLMESKNKKRKKKRRRTGDGEEHEIAESIGLLAEVVVRSEKARVDTMKELEKVRAEAEVKRSEMELKRSEMIANTQLEIARMFVGKVGPSILH